MASQIADSSVAAVKDRFDWWVGTLEEIGMGAAPDRDFEQPFRAQIVQTQAEPLIHLKFDVQDHDVFRLAPQIRRRSWNQYLVYRECSEGAWFDFGGREIVTGPGDIIICDADRPFSTRARADYRHHAWLAPREAIEPHLPAQALPGPIHIPAGAGASAMLVAYVDAMSEQIGALGSAETAMLADQLGRLIAIAAGANWREQGDVTRVARLEQARRHMEQNLARPGLNAGQTAAALGMSVRQLHLLFEPTGESFGQYLRRRRLQECRAALESPLNARRSVTDVALAWGFASLPTFYRLFSQAYGMAPGDVRPRLKVA